MRGSKFHNRIAEEVKTIFCNHNWRVYTEFRYRKNGVTTYLDLLAVKGNKCVGCEIETTVRHVIDNTQKAQSAGIMLWIIAPSRKLCRQVKQKLSYSNIATNHPSIRILLLGQLESELKYLSEKTV